MEIDSGTAAKNMTRLKISSAQSPFSFEVFWCRIMRRRYEKSFTKLHSHSFYEFHLALNGSCTFHIGDTVLSVKEHEFLLIPPSVPHEYASADDDFEDFVAGFQLEPDESSPGGRFMKYVLEQYAVPRSCPASERMTGYVRDMEESACSLTPAASDIAASCFRLLILRAAHILCPDYRNTGTELKSLQNDSVCRYAEEYIQQHLSGKLTSDMVAQALNMSARQLNRILHDNYQTTVSRMIRAVRLKAVRRDLADSSLTLEQIAERTGFSSEFNMSRFFRQAEGMAPGIYRKSLEK